MLNNASFETALRAFNKMHTSVAECLRAALEAFRMEEARRITSDSGLTFHIVGTEESGPDTALLVTGFSSVSEIEAFVAAKNAPGK